MPELPEVETVCRSLARHLTGRMILSVTVRNPKLRTPLCETQLNDVCAGRTIVNLRRRAKYIIAELDSKNALLLHLGMTGKFRIVKQSVPPAKHEHVLFQLDNGDSWRYEDTRRFGSVKCVQLPVPGGMPESLECLGPEPLTDDFDDLLLFKKSRKKTKPLKNFIMDNAIVVGVGNIYAAEALFLAGLRPATAAGRVPAYMYDKLALTIKQVLADAVQQGGTTLRDFVGSDGQPGYFAQHLNVYGRSSEPCRVCATQLTGQVLGQRATVYCPNCQRSQGFARD